MTAALLRYDHLIAGTAGGAAFVAFACAALLAYGRARDRVRPARRSGLSEGLLQLALWVTPTALCALVFLAGVHGQVDAAIAPADALPIGLVAEEDHLRFDYGDGVVTEDALRIPATRPVRLTLRSIGAPTTLVAPALRLRLEARPGHDGERWLIVPDAGGVALGGDSHGARLEALPAADFDRWLNDAGGASLPPAEYGRKLFARSQCQTCHSLDGSTGTGPSLKGAFGRAEELADGSTVVVDAAYVKESILDPGAKVVKGFQPVMPPFRGQLDDKQIAALTAFIEAQRP